MTKEQFDHAAAAAVDELLHVFVEHGMPLPADDSEVRALIERLENVVKPVMQPYCNLQVT